MRRVDAQWPVGRRGRRSSGTQRRTSGVFGHSVRLQVSPVVVWVPELGIADLSACLIVVDLSLFHTGD